TPETARDLRGALSYGPEVFEQRYVFRIPTHGRYYTPTASYRLFVFVRLAHDRRLGGVVLFLYCLLVLVVFIRISGRHRVAHDHEETPVDQLCGKFLGDVLLHVVAPRGWTQANHSRPTIRNHLIVVDAASAGHRRMMSLYKPCVIAVSAQMQKR